MSLFPIDFIYPNPVEGEVGFIPSNNQLKVDKES